MKCLECPHISFDGRFEHSVGIIECGCSYGVADGRWNFSIGYTNGNSIDMLVYPEFIQIETHPKCPLNEGN